MAINKATLAKEVDGKIEYIYPKTTADLVEYTAEQTVEQKIQSIDQDITAVNKRVTTLATGVSSGSVSTTSDAELFDIRNPNRDVVGNDVEYYSAGEAVRGQIGALSDEIANTVGDLYKGVYYEEFSVNGEVLCTSDNEPMYTKVTIADLAKDGFELWAAKLTQRILDSKYGAVGLAANYTDEAIKNYLNIFRQDLNEYKSSLDDYKVSLSNMIENALQVSP